MLKIPVELFKLQAIGYFSGRHIGCYVPFADWTLDGQMEPALSVGSCIQYNCGRLGPSVPSFSWLISSGAHMYLSRWRSSFRHCKVSLWHLNRCFVLSKRKCRVLSTSNAKISDSRDGICMHAQYVRKLSEPAIETAIYILELIDRNKQ